MPTPNDLNPFQPVPVSGTPLSQFHILIHQQFKTALDSIQGWLGLPPNLGGSALLSRMGITPSIGPIFWLGASYEDNGYNYNAVQLLAPPTTVSGSWAFQSNTALGQQALYRWTTAGSVAGNLGRIYAVSGSSWNNYITSGVNTTIATQAAKLISDYPGGLPTGSVIVIHCGINELQYGGLLQGGGIFSDDGTTVSWAQSGFTMPAANATVSVPVTSSTHCVAGANNLVLVNGGFLMTVSSIPDGTHIQLTNSGGNAQGTVVPSGTIQAYSAAQISANIGLASTGISNLLTAGATQIIFTICPNLGQLPNFNSVSTLATTTWTYWKTQVRASIYPNTAKQVSVFDMSAVTANLITNPTAYGLKDATTQWNSSSTINQNDLMWFDGFHQNAPPHVEIASQFLATIKRRAYLTPY